MIKDKILRFFKRKKSNKILEQRKDEYISFVAAQAGWDKAKAKAEMDKFVEQGVPYRYYVKKRLWSRKGKGLERSLANIEKERRYDRYSMSKHAGLVAEITGKSKKQVKRDILESNLYTDCSPRDYYEFRFWEKPLEEQMKYYTKGTVERLIMKYNTNLKEVAMIRNKVKFAKKFGDLFGRVWFTNIKLTFEEFLEKTEGLDYILCKPVFGTHGEGVEKLEIPKDEEGKKALYDVIMSKPKSMCEEYIVQHPDIAAFNSSSVNTVRLMTILDKGEVHYMYSVLRLGCGGVIDGFGGGGFFTPVDVETGILCRDGMNFDYEKFVEHPLSHLPVKGFQIPNWDKVRALAAEAAQRLEGAHMIGWDIAVTPDGAVLIEGNSESNYQFAQLPYVDEGIGVKYKFEKFLK